MLDVRLPDYNFTIPIDVRFRDLDAMGHLNNAVAFTFFEQARTRYWLSLMGDSRDPKAIGFIVVRAECDYVSPALLGESLLVGCKVSSVGRSTSFTFDYEIVCVDSDRDAQARLVCRGRTVQALYDWKLLKTVPLSEELRGRIESREGRTLASRKETRST